MSFVFCSKHRGFTLVEIMVVISIILTLALLSLFPYSYYIERSYVDKNIDMVGQSWILSHKDIRNGKLFDISQNANKVLIFRKGAGEIEQYLLSGTTIPSVQTFSTNPAIKKERSIVFDTNIRVLGFSGAGVETSDTLLYYIQAPYATGSFSTGTTLFSSTGILLTIGYDGADIESGRAKQILLRPYLQ